MNDHDWLDEELRNLPDLTAPASLLPDVMERVRARSAQPVWIRFWREHWILLRNSSLGLSIASLVLLFWLNPAQLFASLVALLPIFRVTAQLLNIAITILDSGRVLHTPLWIVVLGLTAASYGCCVIAASTVQRLAVTSARSVK
jgi:hypothetical protein